MEKITVIIAIVSSILSLGMIGIVRGFIKELKEAIAEYNKAKEDGFTDEERIKVADAFIDVIQEGVKIWNVVLKAIGIIKKKKKEV